MKIYDISQEVFGCSVYPGDPKPEMDRVMSISNGDICNLTSLKICAHNGTHVDAPFHFLDDGDTIDQVDLRRFVGPCYVAHHDGDLTASDAEEILSSADKADEGSGDPCRNRILIGGKATVTIDAARVFSAKGILLVGNELLGAKVVLLEGIRLEGIKEGRYFLCAQPLNLGGCDGAPVRAVLTDFKDQ